MKKRLLIVGAGGFGREVFTWARHIEGTQNDWEVWGFLDDNPLALRNVSFNAEILGSPQTHDPREDELFVTAIGDPATRLRLSRELELRGAKFATLVHPTAIIGIDCKIGAGSILCPFTVATTHVKLGRHTIVNLHSTIGHDATLGAGVTLSDHCDITGGCKLGDGAFVGSHASVLPNVQVGDYSKIGAGSVVMKDVADNTTVLGIPAKAIFSLTKSPNCKASA